MKEGERGLGDGRREEVETAEMLLGRKTAGLGSAFAETRKRQLSRQVQAPSLPAPGTSVS